MRKLVWLHLSDIHFLPSNAWQDSAAHTALIAFITRQMAELHLQIDLVFCTGDIAFGAVKVKDQTLGEQYAMAGKFFDKILVACKLDKTRLFVVPGNHDIDRGCITRATQQSWTRWGADDQAATMEKGICRGFAGLDADTKDAMRRLTAWGEFVAAYLPHQHPVANHHHYAQIVNIRGRKIGIAGFNSAWTCAGDNDDRTLWLAAEPQFAHMRTELANADIKIGLIHHPHDWFNVAEREKIKQRIGIDHHFWLHGHTHSAWVTPQPSHIILSAGAVSATSEGEFGCNLVQLDFATGKGQAHLYRYKKAWNNWIPANEVPPDGASIWPFDLPQSINMPETREIQETQETQETHNNTRETNDVALASASALAQLNKLIAAALDEQDAKPLRVALCGDLRLATSADTVQLLQALDSLLGLEKQMHTLQRAVRANPIPPVTADKPHAIERAAAALYMRAAILAVNVEVAKTLCGGTGGVTVVPEKSEILIAVLMAVLRDEVRDIRLHEEFDDKGKLTTRNAKGEALIDLDQIPFDPFKDEEAIANEVAHRVDKSYIGGDKFTSEKELAALQRHIKRRVVQSKAVHAIHFRFIVSHAHSEILRDDAECEKLFCKLGIPITRIAAISATEVETMLGVSSADIEDFFVQFLELVERQKK